MKKKKVIFLENILMDLIFFEGLILQKAEMLYSVPTHKLCNTSKLQFAVTIGFDAEPFK